MKEEKNFVLKGNDGLISDATECHKLFIDGGEQVYTLKQNDPSYTMPIPDAVLIKNKKLEQNPLAPKRES